MDRGAPPVAEHLDLDVARLLEIFFDVDGLVAEGRFGLGPGGGEGVRQLGLAARDLHAAPAAPGRRLDQDRVAYAGGNAFRLSLVGNAALGARHARYAEALGRALRLDLVAHDADVLRLRADEGDAVIIQDVGEAGVLR